MDQTYNTAMDHIHADRHTVENVHLKGGAKEERTQKENNKDTYEITASEGPLSCGVSVCERETKLAMRATDTTTTKKERVHNISYICNLY